MKQIGNVMTAGASADLVRQDNKCASRARLEGRGIVSWLLRLLGRSVFGIEVGPDGVTVLSGTRREIPFTQISGLAELRTQFGGMRLVLPLRYGKPLVVAGTAASDAATFVDLLNEAWRCALRAEVDSSEMELRAAFAEVEGLKAPQRYPAACRVEPLRARIDALFKRIPKTFPESVLTNEQAKLLKALSDFLAEAEFRRDAAIERYVASELTEMKSFFDTIEAHPMTPEQRLAVVTDEDATLILAGAGSGKTSVIVTKAAHLIQRGIRKPEEVLLMAFGRDAAAEMATRIEERCGASIDALTFHALGNRIIREVEHGSPALAAHANDDAQFRALLREILLDDLAARDDLRAVLLRWFSEFFFPYKSEWDFETLDDYYQYVEANELRTLKGEKVRSFEECEIANWLCLNGIGYEYEPVYEHNLPENDRRAYTPDFRLTDSGVYIEHFGVRKSRGLDGSERLTTAPHVDRDQYLEGMAWKRKVHEDHGTTLVETFSYERVEGRLTEALAEKLAPFVTPEPIPPEEIFAKLSEMGQVDAFTQMLGTFLRHFKSSGAAVAQCRAKAEKSRDVPRSTAFLTIFEPVYEAYQRRLGDRIDFEDMIMRATEHVRSGRFRSPYRHLLVDEFQDISEGRAKLLLALKHQHEDAQIFAVGDDWQSIYRFTGADIHLMRDFGPVFGGRFAEESGVHKTVDLGRTFRSVDKVALPARSFVLQNPSQIAKKVMPAGESEAPAIKVAYYGWAKEEESLRAALEQIELPDGLGEVSVLLLGRYHFVKPSNLSRIANDHPRLKLRFMTVHASKGLEADHVVILNASSARLGFPSEVVDDPLLDLVLPKPESFDHAEERRLFYVALTRARRSVTILADRQKPSAFVRELVSKPEYETIVIGGAGVSDHRCGKCGGRMLAQVSKAGKTYFACEHRFLCGEMLRPCSECAKDLPVQNKTDPSKLVCSCGAQFPACPSCADGWLVERSGRYGRFLGCVKYPECKGTRNL